MNNQELSITPNSLVLVERIESKIFLIKGEKVMIDRDLAELYGVTTGNLNKFGISKTEGRGGRRYLPYAFTEQGVAMLSSVLNSKRAIMVNIQIMRVFTRIRKILASHEDIRKKIESIERKVGEHDDQFRVVFEAIKNLIEIPAKKVKRIGFLRGNDE